MMSVIFLENIEILKTVNEHLNENMYSKVLIIKSTEIDEHSIFEHCFRNGLLNVVILEYQEFTTYLPFTNDLKAQRVDMSNIFENDFKNFHGLHIKLGGNMF